MKQYKVKYSEDFYKDLQNIVNHIIDVTGSTVIARGFYNGAISAIGRRSFSAESFEKFIPYSLYLSNALLN